MATTTGTTLINRAAIQLTDLGNIRWTRAELLGWLNDGQRQIVQIKPTSNNKTTPVKMSAGTRQLIPTDGWLLLDIIRNINASGNLPGPAVRIISRELLDAFNINWHNDPASAVVQNYVFSLEDQTAFYVYPPADGTGYLEVNYSQVPADLINEANPINVNDIFQSVLLDYMLFRACAKDAEYVGGPQLAQQYFNAFSQALESKDKAEMVNNPDLELQPPQPGTRGGVS